MEQTQTLRVQASGDIWLVVGDERFAASWPMPGDVTGPPSTGDAARISAGVAASSLARLWALSGRPASLQSENGRKLLDVWLERVDARIGVVVARVLKDGAVTE
ncbi:MAG: hypothetical protein IRZ16_13880 [Myxococcaceae bacterium]|nr:hypothetical protein [Myxococcaceae bacterium]